MLATWPALVPFGSKAAVRAETGWADQSLKKLDKLLDDLGTRLEPNFAESKAFARSIRSDFDKGTSSAAV